MAKYTFADRYAEAGLSPSAQMITSRQEPAKRIVANINDAQILDLVSVYYAFSDIKLEWFRDEFVQEDASFSLVNNDREARVLAALILGELIDDDNATAILAVCVGGAKGLRIPQESPWLLVSAEKALVRLSVEDRVPPQITTKVTPTQNAKVADDIAALGQTNDWPTLISILGKIREEANSSAKTIARQVANALDSFESKTEIMREESQMLWWLIGGHSRTLERSFTSFCPQQAAVVGAVDLGVLTTYSQFGPVAIPAMLERVIASAKNVEEAQLCELAVVVDSFAKEDLDRLNVPTQLPAQLAPITSAIVFARTMGIGAWHSKFHSMTGLDSSIPLEPIVLAELLYREHLLGQLL
jgi:hypothetical protein